jgi:hypothetical protein
VGFGFEEARLSMVAQGAAEGNQIIHSRSILPEREAAAQSAGPRHEADLKGINRGTIIAPTRMSGR